MEQQNNENAIRRLPMPAELLNELFVTLPLGKAFVILAKMPNGLLAWNVRKMLKSIKMAIEVNKLNAGDCSPNLTLSINEFVVDHCAQRGFNSVRSVLPVPQILTAKKAYIVFYFEVEIIKQTIYYNGIGFCDRKFSFKDKAIGYFENSIGIWTKYGILIEGNWTPFQNAKGLFNKGDVIGIGLLHCPANSSLKCFATSNGELLGLIELSPKFIAMELFPIITLYRPGDSMRANFGKEKWSYDIRQLVQ